MKAKISSRRLKRLSKRAMLFFVLSGLAFSLALFFYFIPNRSSQSSSAQFIANSIALLKQEQVSSGLPALLVGRPVRLKIPMINVDAVIDSVGLTRQGAVGVPKGPATAAWFNLGPRPGESGSAVITGHYGPWVTGQRSVFDNINKLRKGDKLSVKDDKGVMINFVVREIRLYTLKTDASAVFISADGKPHLNLITCEGVWNKVSKTYSNRLVVFTDKE